MKLSFANQPMYGGSGGAGPEASLTGQTSGITTLANLRQVVPINDRKLQNQQVDRDAPAARQKDDADFEAGAADGKPSANP